jgi:SpoVK/Ycf46/Vps4 family AAA+-type ATPase
MKKQNDQANKEKELPPELAHLDKELVAKIENDIIDQGQQVTFDDIAGLEFAKKCVQELICWYYYY